MTRDLVPTLRVVETSGDYGRALTGWTKLTIGGDEGAPQVLEIEYDSTSVTWTEMEDQTEVVVLIDGAEYPDMRFTLDEESSDEITDGETGTWAGVSSLNRLAYGIVYPASFPDVTTPGEQLVNDSPGKAIRRLVEKCQARGALAGITLGFTDAVDSSGAAWGETLNEFIDMGRTLLDLVQTWATRKLAIARMVGDELQLFKYGNHGDDLSNQVILLRSVDIDEGPKQVSSRATVSAMLAASDLTAIERTDASSTSRYGRREGFLSQSQVPDTPTLQSIADGTMALTARQRETYTYGLTMSGRALPMKHYQRGDVVQVRTKTTNRVMRVRQLSLEWSQDGSASGSVQFGQRFKSADERLAERLEQLTGGSMDGGLYQNPNLPSTYDNIGGGGPDPEPVPIDRVAPKPPTAPAVTNVFYDATKLGQTSILATIQWTPPTQNVDDTDLEDLGYYQLEWKDDTWWDGIPEPLRGDYWISTQWTPSTNPVRSVALPAPNRVYDFRLRAVDIWGNPSAWVTFSYEVTGPVEPPDEPPSAPLVAPVLFGALEVGWDGLNASSGQMDDDVRSVDVHVSTASGFTPTDATLKGEIARPADGAVNRIVVTDLDEGVTYYVRLVAKDAWGLTGDPSVQASGVPGSVFGDITVGPENLTFTDFGNLVPDGSFERAEYRAGLKSQVSPDGVTWTDDTRLSWIQNTGSHVLLNVPSTATNQWLARATSPAPTGVDADGVFKDGSGVIRWGSASDIAFDPTVLYRISARIRVDRNATNGTKPAYVSAESKNASGFLNLAGLNAVDNMVQAAAKNRPMVQADGWRTWTGYVMGTVATPATQTTEGTSEAPLPLPNGTTRFGIQVNLDAPDGDGKWHLGQAQITRVPSSVDGVWSAQLTGAGSATTFQRIVLTEIPSGGGSEQYYVRFWCRLLGPRTTMPTVFGGVRIMTEDGSQVAVSALPLRSSFSHDGWYLVEGRVSRAPDAQYQTARRAELYLGTYGLMGTQQVQFDAVEIRQVATSVLIADASIEDAKIQSLSATKITAGTLSAVVTVSGTIATALSGARVQIDSSGFKAYDGSNVQTVGISSADGSAFFNGSLGNTNVTGYVRAVSGSKQVALFPSGGVIGSQTYPGVLTSPGFSPLEIGMGFFGQGGVSTQPFAYFRSVMTTSSAALDGRANGARTGLSLFCQDTEPYPPSATSMVAPKGWVQIDFPAPKAGYALGDNQFQILIGTGGGQAFITNSWATPIYPPEYTADDPTYPGAGGSIEGSVGRQAGFEVAFVGRTRFDQEAGMVVRSDDWTSPFNKGAVWVDFRRSLGTNGDGTGATNSNRDWVGVRAASFSSMSESRTKTDIQEIGYSALDVVRENPSKKWKRKAADFEGHHLGPMADGLPPEVAPQTNDGKFVELGSAVGLLWKAIEELLGRIEELEAR